MNNDSRKLRHTQKEESYLELHEQQKQTSDTKEFASVDELLRHDAKDIVVPPEVALKLNESIGALPKPVEKPWWKRIFSA